MGREVELALLKNRVQDQFFAKPNVVGVGIGRKIIGGHMTAEMCLMALVRRKVPRAALSASELVPKRVDGAPTDVLQVGELRAMQARTGRWRPIPGGVSIGHYRITAGTLGCVVRDRRSGDHLILSNNHVLADINQGQAGDPILQPGAADGGRGENDTVAVLERFIPIAFSVEPPTCQLAQAVAGLGNALAKAVGSRHRLRVVQLNPQATNRVDAALARPLDGVQVLDEILDIGQVAGITPPRLGMPVRKSGRTTGFTTGTITVLDAALEVNYGQRVARFDGQIVTTPMSQPGDSGSLLVAGDSLLAVGLLFAGSSDATIFNPIQWVLDQLEVVL